MQKDKVVGFTCSTFDLLHAGHVAMLAEARTQCDYLIVGLQSDPTLDRASKNKPVQSVVERQMQLRGSRYVDEIWVYNTEKDLEDLLLMLPIDVRILGVEYENKEFTGREICHKRGIKLYFNGRDHSFSSSNLRKRVFQAESGTVEADK
jgi:glycerol-3-phosphate cytidylyltransferase